jgi:hypothetical protein
MVYEIAMFQRLKTNKAGVAVLPVPANLLDSHI